VKEDGRMILCSMATALLSLATMVSEGLDKDLHETFFGSGANTSSGFVR